MHPEHLYLHFPFCTGRCTYCAFVSGPPPKQPERIPAQLLEEYLQRGIELHPLKTLYCGGGTPALLGERGFETLRTLPFMQFADGYEWTVEMHPAAVTPALIRTLRDIGVTRLSIGVQSFDDHILKRCNRRHTVRQALDAIDTARAAIPDTGIDLIAGLPGVDATLWEATVNQTIALDLPHISVYGLSIDEGSHWHQEGLSPPDADRVCDALTLMASALADAGLTRYEISNYAKDGFRCQHNLNTWRGGDYLGLGRGAASRLGALRRYGNGTEEILDLLSDALERTFTSLRTDDGFHPEAIIAHFPLLAPALPQWQKILQTARTYGLLTEKNAPTNRGFEIVDAIERELLACIENL